MSNSLSFSPANNKLKKLAKYWKNRYGNKPRIYSFDVLAGYTCPFAKKCKAWAVEINGTRKIQDSPHTLFRCYAASNETQYPATFNLHKRNTEVTKLRSSLKISKALLAAIPDNADIIRLHASGDFRTQTYFYGWLLTALARPDLIIYAYTKATPFIVKYRNEIPKNFRLIASWGGTHDSLILQHNLRSAMVVYSQAEADSQGLPIDHTDELACDSNKPFALLIHGTQPEGSPAAKAWYKVRKNK